MEKSQKKLFELVFVFFFARFLSIFRHFDHFANLLPFIDLD